MKKHKSKRSDDDQTEGEKTYRTVHTGVLSCRLCQE